MLRCLQAIHNPGVVTEAEFIECVKRGDRAVVESAIKERPEIARAAADGVSAVLWSVYYGQAAIGRVLADAKGDLDVFEAAALGDRTRLKKLLAEDKALAHKVSADGFTPLGYAAYFGHREVAQDLLRAGVDPNVKSSNPLGVAPLHSALAGGHKELAKDLIGAGADVNTQSAEGWSPLHYVAHSGDIETARLLLEKGADVTLARGDGMTAAEVALEQGHTDLAELIQEAQVGGV